MPIPSQWLTYNFHKIARELPKGAPTIPVGHPLIGQIGFVHPGREFKLQGMSSRTFDALMRDEDRIFLNPQKYRKKYLRECGAITSWDGILANRAAGAYDDRFYIKNSQVTVANQWSALFRSGGVPGAGAYTAANAGASKHSNAAGAFWFPDAGAGNTRYLLNFGVQHNNGTNIVLLNDLLYCANNIITTANANNTAISEPTPVRYATGDGTYITFDVESAALGAGASNMTVSYNDSAGNAAHTTAALALTASCATFRLQPIDGGFMMPLAAGDIGVRTVTNTLVSANMGAASGTIALLHFRPLLLIPTLSITTYVERSTPGMLSGVVPLPKSTGGNNSGCLNVFVLTSAALPGLQNYTFQTVEG